MTVPYRILIGGPVHRPQVEEKITTIFARTHQVYNKWNPTSEISAWNLNLSTQLSDRLLFLLEECDRMWKLTEGKFDPTILGKPVGWQHLLFEGHTLHKSYPGIQIDLGGIAKGQTVDELIEELQALGYPDLLVEWGGDFRASGSHPEGRPWKVAIKNPFGGFLDEVELQDESLATSGDYAQFTLTQDGRFFTHIVDPSSGAPLERKPGSIVSCSVKAKTCREADALATALMLFEKGIALEWTANHPEYSCYLIDN